MASNEMSLAQLKERLDQIKSDVDKKHGEKDAILASLLKDFGVKKIDDLYKKEDELRKSIDVKQEEKDVLLKDIDGRLKKYGY
jgi:hypothetical protein